jgi:hypothetical protein
LRSGVLFLPGTWPTHSPQQQDLSASLAELKVMVDNWPRLQELEGSTELSIGTLRQGCSSAGCVRFATQAALSNPMLTRNECSGGQAATLLPGERGWTRVERRIYLFWRSPSLGKFQLRMDQGYFEVEIQSRKRTFSSYLIAATENEKRRTDF